MGWRAGQKTPNRAVDSDGAARTDDAQTTTDDGETS